MPVEGRVSALSPVISGVPQGTVLGPVLFLIHISDIVRGVSQATETSSFADDTQVKRSIKDPQIDCQSLQQDLQSIYDWAQDVNMHFNSDKFECICYWPGSDIPQYNYTSPDGDDIEEKVNIKDLGIHLSNDLTFQFQIQKTITSASKLVGWALRTFHRRSQGVMITIWKCLIQPKIDYCSQLWSPSDQGSISELEKIQRNFSSQIVGMENKDYWERLAALKLYSQERRRERYAIIFLWKISQGFVHGYDIPFTTSGRRGRLAVPKNVNRNAPATVRRAMEASLAVKGVNLFNLLPQHIRNINASNPAEVLMFKTTLDTFLRGVPDQPTIPGRPRAADTNSLIHQLPLLD